MANRENGQAKVDAQYRTMLILWFAFLSTIVMYFVISLVVPRPEEAENRMLTLVFSAMSAFLVVVSFVVKRKFLSRSVDEHQVRLVNTGFVLAAAFCEGSALLGLLDLFVARDRYYFILMVFSFVGMLFHFPKRSHLIAASFKSGSQLN
jgi:hypothetical protein